jgi:DNA-binding MarR family transcriptional regulator
MSMAKANAAKVWSLNYRLLTSVITEASADIEKLDLETKEFFVLADIEECPYPAELAARLCMPKPTITVYLKSLEAKGFVRREIDPEDLRRHRLIVTPAGRKVVVRARTVLSDAYAARLARLTAAERDELQRLLEKLG